MDAEKLESIQRRIKLLRAALEDESLLTEVSVDGVSERLDRAQIIAELKDLEAEEALLTGRKSRLYGIRLS